MITYESIKETINQTEGLMHKHLETELLFNLASSLPRYKNILEIGSYKGLSSLCLAFGAKNIDGQLFCASFWCSALYADWKNNMNKNHINAIAIAGDANLTLKHISIDNIGMIFIDSGHSYEDCKIQFELSTKNIQQDCLIAFHDYGHPNYPGVKQYCDEITNHKKLTNTNKIGSIFYGYINI